MKPRLTPFVSIMTVVLAVGIAAPLPAAAQDQQAQRLAGQHSPDEMVSFGADTSFPDFIVVVNLIAQQATGKQVVDPMSRTQTIGIEVQNMYFLDALDLVLSYNNLSYRETSQYYIIQPAQQAAPPVVQDADEAAGRAQPQRPVRTTPDPATLESREIEIQAVLFEIDQRRAREIGLDWGVFLDNNRSTRGGAGGSNPSRPRFLLNTGDALDVTDRIQPPEQVDFASLNEFVRFAEQNGAGQTIANPFTTVQSGEEGRIQIGTDIPIQTRDFSGNTLTQFFSTGIIIEVTPTLIEAPLADTAGAPTLPFVHLDVRVEKSGARPSETGIAIDRNTATTKVLLLDGERTVIGGLYSTEQTMTRVGIPILKDLPPWFFGLRYIFGRTTRADIQKELVIIIQANVVDSIPMRAERPFLDNQLEMRREQINQILQSIGKPPYNPPAPPNEQ